MMSMVVTAKSNFVRCQNSFNIPESLCTLCLHTIVARDFDALEQAESRHDCSETQYGTSAFD